MDNIGNSRQRKQRRNLSLEDKINIIKRKETDVRLSDEKLANELGVDRSTISGILRKKEKLLQHVEEDSSDEEETIISVRTGRQALDIVKKFLEQILQQKMM